MTLSHSDCVLLQATRAAAAAAAAAAAVICCCLLVGCQFVAAAADSTEKCTNDGPLGMISGEIKDWQISSSAVISLRKSPKCTPQHGRLYQPKGYAWCPGHKGASEWLQIDLGVQAILTGIMTQGRCNGKDWVDTYSIDISDDAKSWRFITGSEGNLPKVFLGNRDSCAAKHNFFDQPVRARFVRIHPKSFPRHPCLRVELVGCQTCKQLLAPPPYSRLLASSERGRAKMRTCAADFGHVMTDKAWCARKQNLGQWLQLDLGPATKVTAIVTKGRGDGRRGAWVTRFRLSYSTDGNMYYFYKDAAHLSPKMFRGNHDRNTERIHFLNKPIIARYVKFHPASWHRRIAMRVGVYGCPYTGEQCGEGFFRVNNATRCQANLAYQKSTWVKSVDDDDNNNKNNNNNALILGSKHRKRHLRLMSRARWLPAGIKNAAVDGKVDSHSCIELESHNGDAPAFYVDLSTRMIVEGLFIFTTMPANTRRRSVYRLNIFVAKRMRQMSNPAARQRIKCGTLYAVNNMMLQQRLHVTCAKAMKGRYVFIEAISNAKPTRKSVFKTKLCEVVVY